MLEDVKNITLRDSCDIFCLKNLVKKPTCFSKTFKPTLIDLILTNQDKKCGKICNFDCGLSDCHNVIAIEVKYERPNSRLKYSKCRSFKNFDEQNLLCDLDNINWDIDPNSDINSQYENFNKLFLEIADKHAPFKERIIKPKQVPYMNKAFRSAVYKKRMYYN